MKKIIKRPDGTEEVVEGTPEEIADYERKLKGGLQNETPKPKVPGLLTDEFQRLMDEFRKLPNEIMKGIPRFEHSPECDITTAQRGWWSVQPPRCTCGLVRYNDDGWYKITYTTNATGNPNKS